MKICVLYCSNSLNKWDLEQYADEIQDDEFNTIGLPCSGKVDIPYIVKAFETGADGVVIVTCKDGECHNLEGNLRAQKRSQAVDSLLEEVGLGKGRITVIQLKDGGAEQIMKEIKLFCTNISKLSKPNADNIVLGNSKINANMSREKTT